MAPAVLFDEEDARQRKADATVWSETATRRRMQDKLYLRIGHAVGDDGRFQRYHRFPLG